MIRVWDRPVRLLHWALAATVALAWATTAISASTIQAPSGLWPTWRGSSPRMAFTE